MKSLKNILLTISIVILCAQTLHAQKREVQYDGLIAPINYKGNTKLTIMGQDNRTQVVDKSQKNDFVGYLRAPAGVPWRLRTKSGNPFINDYINSIGTTLSKAGFQIKENIIPTGGSLDSARTASTPIEADRFLIIIRVDKWNSDQYDAGIIAHKRWLEYDVTMTIYDTAGKEIASKRFNPPTIELEKKGYGAGKFNEFIPEAVRVELGRILNDDVIKLALTGP
jgi:hypothetical protein